MNSKKWISVNKYAPEPGELVLVFNPKAAIKQYTTFYQFNGDVGVFGINEHNPHYNVTHWQRLSENPTPLPSDD